MSVDFELDLLVVDLDDRADGRVEDRPLNNVRYVVDEDTALELRLGRFRRTRRQE